MYLRCSVICNGQFGLKNITDPLGRGQQSMWRCQDKIQNIHGFSKAKVSWSSSQQMENRSPGVGQCIFPASCPCHLGWFLLPLLPLNFSQPFVLSPITSAPAQPKEQVDTWTRFLQHMGLSLAVQWSPRSAHCIHSMPQWLCFSIATTWFWNGHHHHAFCPSEVH